MAIRNSRSKTPPSAEDLPEAAHGNRWVTMTNALTRAGHGLTLSEKRIVMLAVSKLDSKVALPANFFTRITAAEYAEAFDLSTDTAYEQLRDAARNLYRRQVSWFEPHFVRKGKPLVVSTSMRWVGERRECAGLGWIELGWWPGIIPHLTKIKGHFTSYQLRQATALRSIYSWRLMELLMRFKAQGWAHYPLDEFLVSMDAPATFSLDFGRVKQRILLPACKELREKDGFVVVWVPVKTGRKVTALNFNFHRDPQGDLFRAKAEAEAPVE